MNGAFLPLNRIRFFDRRLVVGFVDHFFTGEKDQTCESAEDQDTLHLLYGVKKMSVREGRGYGNDFILDETDSDSKGDKGPDRRTEKDSRFIAEP